MDKLFRRRKKGTLGEPFVDFWSYIVAIGLLISFLFVLNFNQAKAEDLIKSKVGNLNIHGIATSYLKTPLEFHGQDISVGDLIISMEQDIIELEKLGKKAGPCTFYDDDFITKIGAYFLYDVKIKDNEKCQALLRVTQALYEKTDDDTTAHMIILEGRKATWTDITVWRKPADEKQDKVFNIVMTPESGVQVRGCTELIMPPYSPADIGADNNEWIVIRFCQETKQV